MKSSCGTEKCKTCVKKDVNKETSLRNDIKQIQNIYAACAALEESSRNCIIRILAIEMRNKIQNHFDVIETIHREEINKGKIYQTVNLG